MGNSENRAKRRRLLAIKEILSWMVYICGAVLIALLLRIFVFELVRVDGPSMQPTLYRDQTVFVEKLSIARGDVDRFEVVIARYPGREGAYVKRVVGLPGDTIEIRSDGHLYINGVLQEEPISWSRSSNRNTAPIPCPRAAILSWGITATTL